MLEEKPKETLNIFRESLNSAKHLVLPTQRNCVFTISDGDQSAYTEQEQKSMLMAHIALVVGPAAMMRYSAALRTYLICF